VLDAIQSTPYATWVRESWGWPFALTFHAFGNAIVVGLIFIICLRLLGLFRTIPYTSLQKLIPVMDNFDMAVSAVAEAKAAADRARSGAAKLAFWMTAYLLFGAFAASLAAVEGGQLRDGTWNDRRLVPRPW